MAELKVNRNAVPFLGSGTGIGTGRRVIKPERPYGMKSENLVLSGTKPGGL
jgi:hypothetical protein